MSNRCNCIIEHNLETDSLGRPLSKTQKESRERDKRNDFVKFPIRIGHNDYLDVISDGVTGDIIGFKRRRPKRKGEVKQGPKSSWTLPEDVIVEQYLLLTEEEKKQRMFASRRKKNE